MWAYYQTVENGEQTWKVVDTKAINEIRQTSAYHSSIYYLSNLPESASKAEIKYKGDLWFDIDHKPKSDHPDEHLVKAITDTKNLVQYLQNIDVDIETCSLYASGSKGFHLRIPAQTYGASLSYKNLPKIHKYMAQVIAEVAELEGVDLQLYAMGKGKLLRVENKPRSNGKFKTPISFQELEEMTPESYRTLTSRPKVLKPHKASITACPALVMLFDEASTELAKQVSTAHQPISVESLKIFEAQEPTCVSWLVGKIHIKPEESNFNRAKMSLARYLANVAIPSSRYSSITSEFFNQYETSRNKDVELNAAIKFGKDEGFSCQVMQRGFTESPCKDCPMHVKQMELIADSSDIEETEFGYFRKSEKGKLVQLTNFTLKPLTKIIDNNIDTEFVAYDYLVKSRTHNGHIRLDFRTWLSTRDFKQAISRQRHLQYIGGDIDLQLLKTYLTSQELEQGLKIVRNVTSVGIFQHKDENKDIDELVWVDSNWSINASKVADTISYTGVQRSSNAALSSITLDFKNIATYAGKKEETHKALWALLNSNYPHKVGIILGWMCSCWLRVHLRMHRGDKHLPLLNLCGAAGSGKTETASLYSLLGGADYYSNSPLIVNSATKFAMENEVTVSTTVPRIFDEFNEHKLGDRKRFKDTVEILKGCASMGTIIKGTVNRQTSDSKVEVIETLMTSPIVYMGTNVAVAKELEERTIVVNMAWSSLDEQLKYTTPFRLAKRLAEHLEPIAKALMLTTLTLKQDQVDNWMFDNDAFVPLTLGARPRINWQVILTGLDFMMYTSKQRGMPDYLLTKLADLKQSVIEELDTTVTEESSAPRLQNEIDIIMDEISMLALRVDANNNPILKDGLHYCVAGDCLHILLPQALFEYGKDKRARHETPEVKNVKEFEQGLATQPYSLGSGIADVSNSRDWYTFSIKELKNRGINTDRFRY